MPQHSAHFKRKTGLAFTCISMIIIYALRCSFPASFREKDGNSRGIDAADNSSHNLYQWLRDGEEIENVAEDILRCEALDLGCFTRSRTDRKGFQESSLQKSKAKDPVLHVCLSKCFESHYNFAGFHKAPSTCHCSRYFRGFVTNANITVDVSADLALNCTSSLSVRVYRKTTGCEDGISQATMERRKVAYVRIPELLTRGMLALTKSNITPSECILSCEKRKYALAMPVQQLRACVCSDLRSIFNASEDMQQAMQSDLEGGQARHKAPVYQTLEVGNPCGPPRFLSPGKSGQTVLASFPGSGNTWLRHLIETATGYYTGSAYTDEGLINGGFVGEEVTEEQGSNRVIIVKDHLFGFKVPSHYKSAILLVRNPYDAKISEFTRRTAKSHTGSVGYRNFKSEEFSRFVMSNLGVWYQTSKSVLSKIKSVLIVYYEDIIEDPVRQLRRITDFLAKENPALNRNDLEMRLMCMNLDLNGHFKRQRRKLDFNPFNAFMKSMIDRSISDYARIVKKYQQHTMPASYLNCQ